MSRLRMSRKQVRRAAIGTGLALAVSLLLSVAYYLNFLSGAQQQSTDFFFEAKAVATRPETNRAVIIGIDERRLQEFGRWPWPRTVHADLTRALTSAKPRVVAFDVLFPEPSRDPSEDAAFAAAIREATGLNITVILPLVGQPEAPRRTQAGEVLQFAGFLRPIPALAEAANATAHVNVLPDGDGSVRRMPLVVEAEGEVVPSLGLVAESRFLRRPQVLEGPPTANPLQAGARIILVDAFARMVINYLGPPSREDRRSTFDVVSYADVLAGRADPAVFRDRVVFIGQMFTGSDAYQTPASPAGQQMFGVEIHANTFENLLRANFLREAGIPLTVASVMILAVLGGLILPLLRVHWAVLLGLALLVAYYGLAFLAFDSGLLLNLVYPPLAIVLTFIAMLVYRIVFEESDRRFIQGALGTYTSKAVMEALINDPSMLTLGGEKREMTVLFSDIRGFTSISERLDPQALVALLNEYLTAMINIIFENEGVLDKYMGDAIMAFWGAPVPLSNHAEKACRTAVGMMVELKKLQQKWDADGVPCLDIGIGINTGPMSVGNMGSQGRFDYTVMGDAVNLGSRLEGLNKEYGTNIIVSEFTEFVVRGVFVLRPLDVVAVKGKREPVAIFELLAPAGALDEERQRLVDVYNQGYALYRERRWLDALERFKVALTIDPRDGPSLLYVARCTELAGDPPPVDWDGVYVLKHK